MRKIISTTVFFIVVAIWAGCASAYVETWYGGWVDNNFWTPSNWTDGIPDTTTNARINSGFTNIVINDSPTPGSEYDIYNLSLGYINNNMNTVTMNNGIINVQANVEIGCLWYPGQGTFILNGGHFMGQAIYVGHHDTGIVTVNQGTFEPWGLLQLGGNGGSGAVTINNGTVRAADLTMADASQKVTIKDGMLDVTSAWGDTATKVAGYVSNGWIKAANGYTLHTSTYQSYMGSSGGARLGTQITATRDPIPGDLDGDFKVDFHDFAILAEHWFEGV